MCLVTCCKLPLGELASEQNELDTIKGGIEIRAGAYIYMIYVCHNSSTYHAYIMWAVRPLPF